MRICLRLGDRGKKIVPIGVEFFDQPYLPPAIPFLQSLLALNGKFDVAELFIINEPVNTVALRKSGHDTGLMLIYSPDEIIRDTYVESTPDPAGEDVHPVVLVFGHVLSLR
jgi:hypothetical protein